MSPRSPKRTEFPESPLPSGMSGPGRASQYMLTGRKYTNGAVGNFTHAVALQGTNYACELEVWADGYHMRLVDPYQQPTLYVRYVLILCFLAGADD
jgi:hypothetical protein